MTIKPGAIRFNTDSMKLEIFRGSANYEGTASMAGIGTLAAGQWEEIQATSPEVQTGGTRGVWGSRFRNPNTYDNTMDYVNVDSTGDAIDFGDSSVTKTSYAAISSKTRGIFAGGYSPGAASPKRTNSIELITIASTGNTIDFGDLTQARNTPGGTSNGTRGITAGGTTPSTVDTIDYITIAATGNAVDFGNLSQARFNATSCQSSTRSVFAGGGNPGNVTTIDFITTSTLGNAADFGDLTEARRMQGSGSSNSIRGIFPGGASPGNSNTIDYITIATLGNALNFGDLTVARESAGGCSSPTRAVVGGGVGSSVDTIDYVQIMSTGDAVDFGNLTAGGGYINAVSNGHGGL